MDRDIPLTSQRRQRHLRVAKVAVPLVILAGALALLPAWLRPAVSLARVRTAVVTAGPIDASITASGTVVPAIERVVSSPLDARILRVLEQPGAVLKRGDAVIELDVSESLLALQRAESELRVKDNQQRQTRLGYEKSLTDLDGRIEIKALELETRRATLASHQQLAAQGLLSKEELRRTELLVRQAEIELAQFRSERENAAETTAVQFEGLSLERAVLDRDVADRRRVLELATTKSDRDGVLTWVATAEGALVRRGDVLARIADLSSFRVDATMSDVHSGRIRTGLPVAVRIDDLALEGRVAEVYPTVENGAVRFIVALDDSSNGRLRPSLRADVQVITERRARVLKVARGPFAEGTGARPVFVRRGNQAVRVTAELGVSSFEEVEVRSGLAEGDEIIISDMRDYVHLASVRLK